MIQRAIREVVYEQIRSKIVEGSLTPGAPLRDSQVAETLGVSRTPVREALLRLHGDGFLELSHNRGFRVPTLDPEVARETYQIIWALEVEALREAGTQIDPILATLEALNTQFARAGQSPKRQLLADEKWHRALVGASRNSRLSSLLNLQKAVIKRYEVWFMRDPQRTRKSFAEHSAILDCLARRALDGACDRLEAHWRNGLDVLLREMKKA
jgi:DNA-binding GntR family transcriptional regulator